MNRAYIEKKDRLFMEPEVMHRGAPFWAWNTAMTPELLDRQTDTFRSMGMGGFFMHTRFGLNERYLEPEFMAAVREAVRLAKEKGLKAWLYDEDCWPSGYAGGFVTQHLDYRARNLLITPVKYECEEDPLLTYRGAFGICFDAAGKLEDYRWQPGSGNPQKEKGAWEKVWHVYLKIDDNDPWMNNQAYVDVMSKEAAALFIQYTHEAYKREVGEEFGRTIPGIFTDEPHFSKKRSDSCYSDGEVLLPWTGELESSFPEEYGYNLLEHIPELIWEKGDGSVSLPRYHYHEYTARLFREASLQMAHQWCRQNNLLFTGHLCGEEGLLNQTVCMGEAMACYAHFDIPGLDILANSVELNAAKQAQSVKNQYGKAGVVSELYGVTGMGFDFSDYKFQGDWQAALGVTLRTHHLAMAGMSGERKRDYPPSFNYQSPWHEDFALVENHFSRINAILSGAKTLVKIAVIHPIESFWLHFGSRDHTGVKLDAIDERFKTLTDWLLKASLDFDFLSERLLEEQETCAENGLRVGQMCYETVIVPGCETLRQCTVDLLEEFRGKGGKVIFLGKAPCYEQARPSERVKRLYENCISIPFDRGELLPLLEEERMVRIITPSMEYTDNLIHSLREEEGVKWLFLAHTGHLPAAWTSAAYSKNMSVSQQIRIEIKGDYVPVLYDTWNGCKTRMPYHRERGCTVMEYALYAYDSLLIRLTAPGQWNVSQEEMTGRKSQSPAPAETKVCQETQVSVPARVSYEMSDSNVLLLDCAQYALDDGEKRPCRDLLAIDRTLRREIGIFEDYWIQPWAKPEDKEPHTVTLYFTIESKVEVAQVLLALEYPESTRIELNGKPISNVPCGCYVDREIKTVKLGTIPKGTNTLIIRAPLGQKSGIENCYILGDFGVQVSGVRKEIVEKPGCLTWGSITHQGYPFYSGKIRYEMQVTTRGEDVLVHANYYLGAAIKVLVDGRDRGYIVCPPYDLVIRDLEAGEHTLELVLLGNRNNALEPVHNTDLATNWVDNNTWKTEGDGWSDEYILSDMGIMARPVIRLIGRGE